MPIHKDTLYVPFKPLDVYQLVKDVESYPTFLPWVLTSKVYKQEEFSFYADLTIGNKFITQTYTSHVTLHENPLKIRAEHVEGPFRYLISEWLFHPHEQGTKLEFFIDFELNNLFLKKLLQPFFQQTIQVIMKAFKERAFETLTPNQI